MSPLGSPVSLTDMAVGWQQAGDISSIANTVDFFLMNNFPYFAGNAGSGNSPQDLSNLKSDVAYFESISQGKPLLMAQVCLFPSFTPCHLTSFTSYRLDGRATRMNSPRRTL